MSNLSVSSDTIFITLVVLLMMSMKTPHSPKGWRATFANVGFWLYLLYWIKTFGTIIRIPVHYMHLVSADAVTLWFSWMGCVVVTLSTIVPAHLYHHYKVKGKFAHIQHQDRFKFSMAVLTFHSAAFLVTCLLIVTEVASTYTLLIVWRVCFFIDAAVEAFFLFSCLYLITHISSHKEKFQGMKRHLQITLYMRGGLCGTIVLKLLNALPVDAMASMHLFFLFTGLLAYHLRAVHFWKSKEHLHSLFKKTEQVLLILGNNPMRATEDASESPRSNDNTLKAFAASSQSNHKNNQVDNLDQRDNLDNTDTCHESFSSAHKLPINHNSILKSPSSAKQSSSRSNPSTAGAGAVQSPQPIALFPDHQHTQKTPTNSSPERTQD